MWTMHPSVTFEQGTPSNQLLLGENLDTRLFLENIRILESLMSPSPQSDVDQLS